MRNDWFKHLSAFWQLCIYVYQTLLFCFVDGVEHLFLLAILYLHDQSDQNSNNKTK